VAGKMPWYQQQDFQFLVMQFSGGNLKQKGFFHSANVDILQTIFVTSKKIVTKDKTGY
jgi:hypothetical protein